MTRRERLERKLERRRDWAAGASAESDRRFNAAHKLAEHIPFGQPILVGHHSERHARRDAERIMGNMDKGVEASRRAEHHVQAAAGLAAQLERTVFSDDSDAVEQIEARMAERTAKLERMKELNVAIRRELRKGDGWPDRIGATDQEKQQLLNELLEWWNAQGGGPFTCAECGRIDSSAHVQPQHAYYAQGREGVALCGNCIGNHNRTNCIGNHNRTAAERRKAQLDAMERCAVCTRRGNFEVAGGVLLCGRHLKKVQREHGRRASALGGLALFGAVPAPTAAQAIEWARS